MNPMALLKLKERFQIFQNQHPKVMPFFAAARPMMGVGAVLEIKITDTSGKEIVTNIRVTEEDVETVRMLGELKN